VTKRITAALLGGHGALLLDNLSGYLDSPVLAAALTAENWNERILGASVLANVRVRAVWTATGNNVEAVGGACPAMRANPRWNRRPTARKIATDGDTRACASGQRLTAASWSRRRSFCAGGGLIGGDQPAGR
jgi:hypothetical protein